MTNFTERENAAPSAEPKITPADRTDSSASLKSLGNASDTESAERPVREKLRNTSIAGVKDLEASTELEMTGTDNGDLAGEKGEDDRGRVRRKRSHEEVEKGKSDELKVEKQGRKRSRDLTMSGTEPEGTRRKTAGENNTNETTEDGPPAKRSRTPTEAETQSQKNGLMSPKGKRGREEFEAEEGSNAMAPEVKDPPASSSAKQDTDETTDKAKKAKSKRTRESNSPEPKSDGAKRTDTKAQIPQGSGFSNTSAVSPFAALASSKSPTPTTAAPQPQTSDSAFKSSGFSALAGSTTSGFGALGAAATKPTASVFGGAASTPRPAITGLGNSGSQSPFGGLSSTETKSPFASAGASAFGRLGGGFGGGLGSSFAGGSGPKLSSFGGGSGPKITGLSDKPAKPFGAPADEDEGSGEEGEAEKVLSPTNEEDHKDERFFEQDVETGEEHEETVFVCRAKLYNFVAVTESKKEWKERGLGNLKLNVMKPEEADGKKKARFVMRSDGSHRVALNSPVQKELKVGDVKGGKPSNGYVFFMGSLADGQGQLELLQLKMKQPNAEALWDKVQELQQEM
ncbi:uncharacterized protein K452DRAFT_328656 [Aplosporella prunicola CBS 121167]|uniref:RanBD1 domain-containing protein n=1 Tax=Aplosporella prunicola CBS 121167 TaxID=1176127 RepID=A0A6A6B2J7_9PEZI|nr:uncharacterized protein K452DRAFT_328656 [Aplosporella prunicola CBS 121167]KAF2138432.1 hypothetical protein K452DRAFT_328656 [Aplosporella prunicola CBS 121167]